MANVSVLVTYSNNEVREMGADERVFYKLFESVVNEIRGSMKYIAINDRTHRNSTAAFNNRKQHEMAQYNLNERQSQALGISSRTRDFDVAYEEKRRRQAHVAYCRTRAEEAEERRLRDELKAVELESRRLKRRARGQPADEPPRRSGLEAARLAANAIAPPHAALPARAVPRLPCPLGPSLSAASRRFFPSSPREVAHMRSDVPRSEPKLET